MENVLELTRLSDIEPVRYLLDHKACATDLLR